MKKSHHRGTEGDEEAQSKDYLFCVSKKDELFFFCLAKKEKESPFPLCYLIFLCASVVGFSSFLLLDHLEEDAGEKRTIFGIALLDKREKKVDAALFVPFSNGFEGVDKKA